MTHLTMEQLVALRDGASEPGTAAAREHIAGCSHCAAELDRLHQRIAATLETEPGADDQEARQAERQAQAASFQAPPRRTRE